MQYGVGKLYGIYVSHVGFLGAGRLKQPEANHPFCQNPQKLYYGFDMALDHLVELLNGSPHDLPSWTQPRK